MQLFQNEMRLGCESLCTREMMLLQVGQNTSVRFKLGLDTRFVNKWSDQPEKIFQTLSSWRQYKKLLPINLSITLNNLTAFDRSVAKSHERRFYLQEAFAPGKP